MNRFSKVLKKYMIDHDIKQSDIVSVTGMTKQAVSHLFNRDNISLDKMDMLAAAVGCKLDFVLVDLADTDKSVT